MKIAQVSKLIALTFVLSIVLVGCRKGPKGLTNIPGRTGPTNTQNQGAFGPANVGEGGRLSGDPSGIADNQPPSTLIKDPSTGQTPLGGPIDRANYNADRDTLSSQTVYFDFDKSAIRSSERGKVEAVAAFLKNESPNVIIDIEGHCDERGTSEYNRALGERRALAVREALISLGIIGERISTISYGEDRPADPGHDESAWAKNRRGEFIILRPKQ